MNQYLQSSVNDDIFVIGDCCAFTQEDGTQHILPAGNVGPTDTISIIQRKDNNTFATIEVLMHIHDAEILEFESAVITRDLKTEF